MIEFAFLLFQKVGTTILDGLQIGQILDFFFRKMYTTYLVIFNVLMSTDIKFHEWKRYNFGEQIQNMLIIYFIR